MTSRGVDYPSIELTYLGGSVRPSAGAILGQWGVSVGDRFRLGLRWVDGLGKYWPRRAEFWVSTNEGREVARFTVHNVNDVVSFMDKVSSEVGCARVKEWAEGFFDSHANNASPSPPYRHTPNRHMPTTEELVQWAVAHLDAQQLFRDFPSHLVHSDVDGKGNPRRLLRMPISSSRDSCIMAVEVVDPSTKMVYLLIVPPSVQSCQEAVAATFGIRASEYRPDIES